MLVTLYNKSGVDSVTRKTSSKMSPSIRESIEAQGWRFYNLHVKSFKFPMRTGGLRFSFLLIVDFSTSVRSLRILFLLIPILCIFYVNKRILDFQRYSIRKKYG